MIHQGGLSIHNINDYNCGLCYIYSNGSWLPVNPYVYVNNEWKSSEPTETEMVEFITSDGKQFITSDGKILLVRKR